MALVAAVILSPENLVEAEPYYCMKCRYHLFDINRGILAVSLGTMYPPLEIPRGMAWVQVKCHQCKAMWNFYLN
jgi:hypothetical protein